MNKVMLFKFSVICLILGWIIQLTAIYRGYEDLVIFFSVESLFIMALIFGMASLYEGRNAR